MTIDLEDPSKARLGKLKESSLSQQNATPSPPPASSSFPPSPPTRGPNQAEGPKAQPMRLTTKISVLSKFIYTLKEKPNIICGRLNNGRPKISVGFGM